MRDFHIKILNLELTQKLGRVTNIPNILFQFFSSKLLDLVISAFL